MVFVCAVWRNSCLVMYQFLWCVSFLAALPFSPSVWVFSRTFIFHPQSLSSFICQITGLFDLKRCCLLYEVLVAVDDLLEVFNVIFL